MDWRRLLQLAQGKPNTTLTLDDMKRRILPCMQAIYSEDVAEFERGAKALELLCEALLLEGLTADEVWALVQEARRQVKGNGDAN